MLKDKEVSYSLTKPVAVLAKRVQERLDAQKKFELQKGLKHKDNLTSDSKTNLLLRG